MMLLSEPEVVQMIKGRMNESYVLVFGNPRLVSIIENKIYPPGTLKNEDFELIAGPCLPWFGVFLAKKTPEFVKYMKIPSPKDPDLKDLLACEILARVGGELYIRGLFCKPGYSVDQGIRAILRMIMPHVPSEECFKEENPA